MATYPGPTILKKIGWVCRHSSLSPRPQREQGDKDERERKEAIEWEKVCEGCSEAESFSVLAVTDPYVFDFATRRGCPLTHAGTELGELMYRECMDRVPKVSWCIRGWVPCRFCHRNSPVDGNV